MAQEKAQKSSTNSYDANGNGANENNGSDDEKSWWDRFLEFFTENPVRESEEIGRSLYLRKLINDCHFTPFNCRWPAPKSRYGTRHNFTPALIVITDEQKKKIMEKHGHKLTSTESPSFDTSSSPNSD